jgi:hypothetical protein
MAYVDEVLADSPLLYLPLDGATAVDASANSRPLPTTVVGAWSTGEFPLAAGNSWQASGSQSFRWTTGGWWNTAQMTLEAWVKFSSVAGIQQVIECDSTSGSRRFQFRINSSKLELIFWTSGGPYTATGATTLAAGVAYHVAATVDASGVGRIYVNGVQDGTATGAAAAMPSNNTLSVAAGYGATATLQYFLKGWIDEVAVYGAALSPARIQAHWAARGPLSGVLNTSASVASSAAPYPAAVRAISLSVLSHEEAPPTEYRAYLVGAEAATSPDAPPATQRVGLAGVEAVTSPSAPPATQRVGLAGIEVVSSVDNIVINDCWVWDGSQEVPASVFVWDGAQEVPASLAVA